MRPQRFSCGIREIMQLFTIGLVASMRPQRFSCGIRRIRHRHIWRCDASMRPQRFSCGIDAFLAQRKDDILLQ